MVNSFKEISNNLTDMNRYLKRLITIIFDIALCIICTWLAFFLRLEDLVLVSKFFSFSPVLVSIIIALPVFWIFGLYRTIFRYASLSIFYTISSSILFYGLLYFSIIGIYGIQGIPRSVGIIQPMLLFFAIVISRFSA